MTGSAGDGDIGLIGSVQRCPSPIVWLASEKCSPFGNGRPPITSRHLFLHFASRHRGRHLHDFFAPEPPGRRARHLPRRVRAVDEFPGRRDFVASTDVVDWYHPDVQAAAWFLAGGESDPVKVAKRCFEWVRDEIQHCMDFQRTEFTCRASEVLTHGTGFCYAKSHLLAALLRANGIPAGFCYQRLSIDGVAAPFCLHGLNAARLDDHGWYRVDARGNKAGACAEFEPPHERLAFATQIPGERMLPEVLADPLPMVVDTLRKYSTVVSAVANLPDLPAMEESARFPSAYEAR
jgi:transglutaminase-like putative cysteine protease